MSKGGKRLAILAPLKRWGGIERKMLILCREFLDLGIQPELVLTRGGQVPYPDEFPEQVKVVDLHSRGKFDATPKFIEYVRRSRPDAILTAKDHAAKVAVVARRLGRLDVPVFVKVTNTLSQTLRRPVKRWTARWLYPWADRIIAISEGVKEDLVGRFGVDPSKIEVIYNPTVTPELQGGSGEAVEHPWLGAEQPPVFIGAGRLTAQKDFVTLVRAFALVRKTRFCRLIILGEGPEREHIEAVARELGVHADVDLPGYVPTPAAWMARSAAFVLSSCYEGLGNVLIEAMAVGTQLVSTDCPSGPREILEDGRYGALVPVGDAGAMASAMEAALDHPRSREQLLAGSKRFQSRVIARRYLETMGLL